MASELRPLSLPAEADAELRMREMGLHASSRSEALRLRRVAYQVHELSRIVAMSFCEPRSWTRVLSS